MLRTVLTERVPTHVDHLTWFTAESFGVPTGLPENSDSGTSFDVHRHLRITHEQMQRFVTLYLQALDEAALPDNEPFRNAVRSHLEFGASGVTRFQTE